MSDSEAAAANSAEAEPHLQDASPAEASDSTPPPTSPDVSTDVAPTRKARRRPEPKPAAEVEEKVKVEEQTQQQPSQALMWFILVYSGWNKNNDEK